MAAETDMLVCMSPGRSFSAATVQSAGSSVGFNNYKSYNARDTAFSQTVLPWWGFRARMIMYVFPLVQMNAEFQRIARRHKKAFLSDQCKEIEENNRMGKTRDLFKKTRDTKGTFHVKMGTIKDRNGMDLTEEEDIKKRWQEYTEKLWKKDLHNPDNHSGVVTHLEPDILECEIK